MFATEASVSVLATFTTYREPFGAVTLKHFWPFTPHTPTLFLSSKTLRGRAAISALYNRSCAYQIGALIPRNITAQGTENSIHNRIRPRLRFKPLPLPPTQMVPHQSLRRLPRTVDPG